MLAQKTVSMQLPERDSYCSCEEWLFNAGSFQAEPIRFSCVTFHSSTGKKWLAIGRMTGQPLLPGTFATHVVIYNQITSQDRN